MLYNKVVMFYTILIQCRRNIDLRDELETGKKGVAVVFVFCFRGVTVFLSSKSAFGKMETRAGLTFPCIFYI